jgi:hypothetical protein
MSATEQKSPATPEEQIRLLQKENQRLQRTVKRYETQMQRLDKMASANEKISKNLLIELEVLSEQNKAQAREAQIEAALERVRTKAMAMHSSEEVADAASVVFQQLNELGVSPFVCAFVLIDAETASAEIWMTDADGAVIPHFGIIPSFSGESYFESVYTGWKLKESFRCFTLEGEALKVHDQWVKENTTIPLGEAYEQSGKEQMERLTFLTAFFSHGYMLVTSPEPFSSEEETLFQRFARAFEQTYTRFLDLQKAEAQAREAQIETALERVRARAMAMHNSQELKDVASELRNQMGLLGQKDLEVCAIHL